MATPVSSRRLVGRATRLALLEAASADATAGRPSLGFLVRIVHEALAPPMVGGADHTHELADPALGAEHYRLATTITDPARASAAEIAAACPERWEFETALDKLKTHQRGPRLVLRSRSPEGVYQEAYGYLLVHTVRALLHEIPIDSGRDPDRSSFTRSPLAWSAAPPGPARAFPRST